MAAITTSPAAPARQWSPGSPAASNTVTATVGPAVGRADVEGVLAPHATARTRDRIVHHYEGIEWWLIEEIVAEELPVLPPRLIEIRDSRPQTVDALTKLDLPAGVDVEIKVE